MKCICVNSKCQIFISEKLHQNVGNFCHARMFCVQPTAENGERVESGLNTDFHFAVYNLFVATKTYINLFGNYAT